MKLRLHSPRRVLGHLPPWRHPDVAEAWAAHEEAVAPGVKSITTHTLAEVIERVQAHDPTIALDAGADASIFDVDEIKLLVFQGSLTNAAAGALTPDEVQGAMTALRLTAAQIGALVTAEDPTITFSTAPDDIAAMLEDFRANGWATEDDAGGWAQTQAGTDLLTGGHADEHSRIVADAIAAQTKETL